MTAPHHSPLAPRAEWISPPLRRLGFRHLNSIRLRAALAVLTIALGTALFVSSAVCVHSVSAGIEAGRSTRSAAAASPAEDALARIRSLVSVSLLALVVGLFIIHNSVHMSVLERAKEIGTLRALGATDRQIRSAALLEWTAVGLAGSALGVALGWAGAAAMVRHSAAAVNALVRLVESPETVMTASIALAGLVLGTGTAAAAAWFPIRRILRAEPVELLRPYGWRRTADGRSAFRIGLVIALAGAGLVALTPASAYVGLTASGAVFLGAALMLPRMVAGSAALVRPLLDRLAGVAGRLAADNVRQFPQRTALTAAAVGGAVSLAVAAAGLTAGFRTAISRWLTDAFPFDLVVTATDFSSTLYDGRGLPRALADDLRALDGVGSAWCRRLVRTDFRNTEILLLGIESQPFLAAHGARGGADDGWAKQLGGADNLRRWMAGEGVYVSRNFAYLFGVRAGDAVELNRPAGPRRFAVLGEVEDYSWPHGTVLMDLGGWSPGFSPSHRPPEGGTSGWSPGFSPSHGPPEGGTPTRPPEGGTPTVTFIDIRLAPGADATGVRRRINALLAGHAAHVFSHAEIRRLCEDIAEQTVSLADVQGRLLGIFGVLAVLNTLLISVVQRKREIGLLRAIGMTGRQASMVVVIEGLLISTAGGMIGIVGGLLAAWFPFRLFTLAVTGHDTPLVLPWPVIGVAFVAAVVGGALASLFPARRAANVDVLEAVGYE